MLSDFFAPLATKVLVGLLGIGLVFHVIGVFQHKAEVRKLNNDIALYKTAISDYKVAVATLRGNQATLEAGVKTCNASIQNLADTRDALTKAGVAALQEVQKAGRSVDRKVREIDSMPTATCEDAFKILKHQ